ncbi:FxsA family protein [Corynebacterium uropygiale]|uniref:FxsA family protein n=1 Tax=Corynebacterium uropygiale TaxID=1775911 RepID=A0A9X1TXY4_9CORY|nr:FxsA family protein [Corynebacterium uropygiale]
MPFLLLIPYVLIECLAFWAVSLGIGTGWALVLLLIFFFGGLLLVRYELQKVALAAAEGQQDPGSAMGDIGLILSGCVLLVLPGFVTGVLGLLLVIRPTRVMMRSILARKVRRGIEDIGVRTFGANGRFPRTTYGDVRMHPAGPASAEPSAPAEPEDVIDEEELHRWSESLRPEDFTDPDDPHKNPPRGNKPDGKDH